MDDMFPFEAFEKIGYQSKIYGQKSYNGVALLAKSEPENVVEGIDGYKDEQTRGGLAIGAGMGLALGSAIKR